MIKKIHACNKMNFSSNINEVIKVVLNPLLFFTKRFRTHKKHKKHKKHKDATKQNHKNVNKRINDFFPLDVSYEHKTLPFLFGFAYVRFCAFCMHKEKKIEKREKSP